VTERPSTDPGLQTRLDAFAGRPVGQPSVAPDEVNQAMIRHWVEAMGDENPVYVDDGAARRHGFAGVIAPPTMLQAWVMRGYKASAAADAARAAGTAPTASAQDELMGLLDGAGFTSVVATNCEQEYVRPLVLGDRLSVGSVIESVSAEKHTGLGDGHFITTRLDFTDHRGEQVATMTFRILKFRPRPKAQSEGGARPPRPRPAITKDIAFFFEGTRQGSLLIQRCTTCGRLRHPPLPSCPVCHSFEWDTVAAGGSGTVFSYVVVHHPQVPAFDYPLAIAVVELDEGTRIVADLIGIDPGAVHIGMPVTLELVNVDDELTLPMFRPAAAPSGHAASGGGASTGEDT
jgi:uncharacterized protein